MVTKGKNPVNNSSVYCNTALSADSCCSLNIGTQYWTDLHGIALKNNELIVAMADIRH